MYSVYKVDYRGAAAPNNNLNQIVIIEHSILWKAGNSILWTILRKT